MFSSRSVLFLSPQIRDFAATFEKLGLSPAYCGTAYGLAEHVVGVCENEANLEGRPLAELSDEDLECVGQVGRLSEGSQVMREAGVGKGWGVDVISIISV